MPQLLEKLGLITENCENSAYRTVPTLRVTYHSSKLVVPVPLVFTGQQVFFQESVSAEPLSIFENSRKYSQLKVHHHRWQMEKNLKSEKFYRN
jgi:hypothetical protein